MGHDHEGLSPTSHEQRVKQRIQVLYTRQTRERQMFMQELKEYRKKKEKEMYITIRNAVGPRWYQALSVPQRLALDKLHIAVYQDDLEGLPRRTATVMQALGLYPRPSRKNLMYCIYLSNHNAMEMLAQLYLITFGYGIEGKRERYSLNAKLILSAILYLGMDHLLFLLRERFRPDVVIGEARRKPKTKPEPPVASPYLQKMVAALYERPVQKRPPPPPLPNLDDLNDPYEEEPVITKPPPPPPPPPPPKKRIPRAVCDALAGIHPIEPYQSEATESTGKRIGKGKGRQGKPSVENKKVYGMGSSKNKKVFRRKPVAPSTGTTNTRYLITGVFEINGKAWYVLGNISILPAQGELIHGGYASVNNAFINIHCGYRGEQPPPKPLPCDCQKQWQETVFKYIKSTKCYCGHRYDLYNEGTFPPDELPYFIKPTRHSGMQFNYHTIFNIDNKELHVDKEFKRIWDTDSLLAVEAGAQVVVNDKKKKKKDEGSSKTCLGPRPRPEDYLRCAIRFMRRLNIAARLPDLHLVPELKEWMRRRIYGPLNRNEKKDLLKKSNVYWGFFTALAGRNYGHVGVPREAQYGGHTTWLEKQKLNNNFKEFATKYKLALFRSHAKLTNLFWRSMFQAEMRDKRFRQIYFAYLFSCMEDIQLIPYIAREAQERAKQIRIGRYVCLPKGVEDLEV